MTDAYIRAIEYYLPEKVLTNNELESLFPEWTSEKIFAKLGIERRHISGSDESASDMAVKAAEKLFSRNEFIRREDIDFILFCTQSPDYKLPSSACIIQDRLGIPKNCGAFDFDLGCSGYIYGLALAKGLILSGTAKNILFLTGETYTKYLAEDDKSCRTLFGDGASASVISSEGSDLSLSSAGIRIGEFVLGTDGRGAKDLIVKTRSGGGGTIFMDGGNIFAFTLSVVPGLVRDVIAKNSVESESVSMYLMHQANRFMLESLRRKMKIPQEKFFMDIREGNTVSNTVPIALKTALDAKRITPGSVVIAAGFGVGLSWGGCALFL